MILPPCYSCQRRTDEQEEHRAFVLSLANRLACASEVLGRRAERDERAYAKVVSIREEWKARFSRLLAELEGLAGRVIHMRAEEVAGEIRRLIQGERG
jgi:hypothetical protein